MKTLPINDILDSLLDLAAEMRTAKRLGAAEVLVDAHRLLKLRQYEKRQRRLEVTSRDDDIEVLFGPRYSMIISESNETAGERANAASGPNQV